MAKVYQFRKKGTGDNWRVCSKKQYDGMNANRGFSGAFQTRVKEDNAKATPNTVIKKEKK